MLDESLGVDALDPNAATDDNVAGNLFPPAFGTPIGLLSNVDLVNTTTTTGEDNEGATTVVTLAIAGGVNGTDSGLQTTDNRQISLFNESGVIVGRMDTAGGVADPAGTVAFAISINNAGEVTVAQYLSLEHPTPGASYDEAVNLVSVGIVNAVVTVTDGDGDVATQNIAIGNAIQFQDDGPTAILPDHAVVINNGAGPGPLPLPTFELDQDGTLTNNYGADNEGGTVRFAASLNNTASGLTSGGASIIYHVSGDGLTLTGYCRRQQHLCDPAQSGHRQLYRRHDRNGGRHNGCQFQQWRFRLRRRKYGLERLHPGN